MRNRIFYGIFSVALLVLVASMVLIFSALYTQYSKEYEKSLQNEAYLVAAAIRHTGSGYFSDLKVDKRYRITYIARSGKVIYDTSVDASKLPNHASRPEVKEAMKTGYGSDTRYSKTLSEKTSYSAVRMEDGRVLRVSITQFTLLTLLLRLMKPILLVLLLTIMTSLLLASRISHRIVKPINEIDLDAPTENMIYPELEPLLVRMEEQNNMLNQRIDKLRGDVDEKTREAEFRKEFTANVSHELKTPLTSISGFAEIMKNGIVRSEDVGKFAGRIYEEAQRLIVLVDDIIKLSQLDENQITAKKERLDLYGVAEEVFYTLDAAAKGMDVKVDLSGKHVHVDGVYQIIEEIVYNLCDNAIKYNKKGGTVRVSTGMAEGRPYICVKDTGIGIPQEDLDRVFERFYRVNKSHSKEIGGTGLGLSIVRHGAAYHNADIRIQSRLGEGTEITVLF